MSKSFQGQWHTQPLQQQMQQMPEESEFATGTEDSDVESQGPADDGGYSSFASQILKDVPEEHRGILEPYVKKWDAGTTRRFQDLSNQYKHYEPLGWDEETTQQMSEVYRLLNEEPESLYNALKEIVEGEDTEAQKPSSEVGDLSQAIQGLPPEITQQLQEHRQVLEALAQFVINEQTQRTEQVEDQEFESYMGLLKGEYGDFDEKYVTMSIANGIDGEAAVKQWQAMAQEILNKAAESTNGLPPAMLSSSGGGAVVQESPQKLGQIPDKDIRNLITNVLTQAQQAGQ